MVQGMETNESHGSPLLMFPVLFSLAPLRHPKVSAMAHSYSFFKQNSTCHCMLDSSIQ